mmetsp:Transcript_76126/g.134419  ORF Transcript_76126/g.134419 Transcript_76126/m.134419 type:complete len:179 (-) Transcript_76126:5-541(-)
MARRIRNRPRLEQFHFTELVTSRPDRHAAWLAHRDNRHMARATPDRQIHRRTDPTWRHVMAPVLTGKSHFKDIDDHVLTSWKKLATSRTPASVDYVLSWPGKPAATVPVTVLSFAFEDAAVSGNLTAEEIIRHVVASAATWPADQTDAPLGYEEVAGHFFEWLDKFEQISEVFCVRVS